MTHSLLYRVSHFAPGDRLWPMCLNSCGTHRTPAVFQGVHRIPMDR